MTFVLYIFISKANKYSDNDLYKLAACPSYTTGWLRQVAVLDRVGRVPQFVCFIQIIKIRYHLELLRKYFLPPPPLKIHNRVPFMEEETNCSKSNLP